MQPAHPAAHRPHRAEIHPRCVQRERRLASHRAARNKLDSRRACSRLCRCRHIVSARPQKTNSRSHPNEILRRSSSTADKFFAVPRATATKTAATHTETYPREIRQARTILSTRRRSVTDTALRLGFLCSCPEEGRRTILPSDCARAAVARADRRWLQTSRAPAFPLRLK